MGFLLSKLSRAVPDEGRDTLGSLLGGRTDPVLRDSFYLLRPGQGGPEVLTLGYTVVYPGCRTRGHTHADLEEVYFVVRGAGLMTIGDNEFEVEQGDAFNVPRGKFHSLRNPGSLALECVWALAPAGSQDGGG